MNDTIIVALISAGSSIIVGFLSYLAVTFSNRKSNAEMQRKMEIQQAVTDTKLEELTREVREHNNFARRMPVVESEITHLDEAVKELKKHHEGG